MKELVASGRLVDIILIVVAFEAVLLVALRRGRSGLRAAMLDILPNLMSGASLMLALRAALSGAGWPVISLCLALAFAAHLLDLSRRLQPRPGASRPAVTP